MVVWCYDVDMAEDADLTEGDMHLARTPISTPPSAQVSRMSRSVPGTLALPGRGSWGRQRGLGGDVKFADRDLEKKWPKFQRARKKMSRHSYDHFRVGLSNLVS